MVEVETEEQQTRAEAATTLRDLADQLDAGGDLSLEIGGSSVTLSPTEPLTVKMEGESDTSGGGPAKQSVEFELVWRTEEGGPTG